MSSKFLVLAASLIGVAAAQAASVLAAPAAPASAAGTAMVPVGTRAAALAPRDDGMDAAATAPATATVANVAGTGVAKPPVEPDPAQSPFAVQDTLLLLAGLLAMGYVVRRRRH